VNALASLALATTAFVGTHFAMSHPLRAGLVARLGERGFAALYSLIAIAALGWIILAWRDVPESTPLWIASLWWWYAASALMLPALILLVGSFVKNPAFPHPGGAMHAGAVRPAMGVFAITRHPMNWSFALWALVHISLWGSPRNLTVAGGILVLAVLGSVGQDRRKRGALYGDAWRGWESRTSFMPFGGLISGKIPWRAARPGWIALLVGSLLWLAITWWHAPIASPIGAVGRGIG